MDPTEPRLGRGEGVRNRVGIAILLLGLVGALPALADGSVVGTVTVTDGSRARVSQAGVVAWLEGGPDGAGVPPAKVRAEYSMRSENKAFVPRVLAIPVGAEVEFPNSDPIFHNVFSVSRTKPFDLGLYKSGASNSVTFDQPGLVRVYCNIHPSMVGFIHVFGIPHYAVTDRDGRFRMDDVPPGRYALKAWDERGGLSSRALVVGEGPKVVRLEIDASGYRERPHLNKYGKPYDRKGTGERY